MKIEIVSIMVNVTLDKGLQQQGIFFLHSFIIPLILHSYGSFVLSMS